MCSPQNTSRTIEAVVKIQTSDHGAAYWRLMQYDDQFMLSIVSSGPAFVSGPLTMTVGELFEEFRKQSDVPIIQAMFGESAG